MTRRTKTWRWLLTVVILKAFGFGWLSAEQARRIGRQLGLRGFHGGQIH